MISGRAAAWAMVFVLLAIAASNAPAHAQGPVVPEPKFAGKTREEWLVFFERGGIDPLMQLVDVVEFFEPPPADVVPRLLKLLRTGNPTQQAAAAEAIEFLGPQAKGARGELWQRFQTAEGSAVEPAGRALAALGPELAPLVGELIALLPSEPDAKNLRGQQAALALKATGKAATLALLAELQHPDPARALRVLPVLATLGPAATDAVPQIARSLDDPRLAVEAVKTLHSVGPVAKPALPALARVFQQEKHEWHPSPFTPHPQKAAVWNTRDAWRLSMAAIKAIGPTEDCLPAIERALASGDEATEALAAESLWDLRPASPAVAKVIVAKLQALFPEKAPGNTNGQPQRIQDLVQKLCRSLSDCSPECKEWLAAQKPMLDRNLYSWLDSYAHIGPFRNRITAFPGIVPARAAVRARMVELGIDPETLVVSPEGRKRIDEVLAGDPHALREKDLLPLLAAARKDEPLRKKLEPIMIERFRASQPDMQADALIPPERARDLLNWLGRITTPSVEELMDDWKEGDPKASVLLHLAGPKATQLMAATLRSKDRALRVRAAEWLVEGSYQGVGAPTELLEATKIVALEGLDKQFRISIPLRTFALCGPKLTQAIAEEYPTATVARREFLVTCLEPNYLAPLDEHARKVLRAALADKEGAIRDTAIYNLSYWPKHTPDDGFGLAEMLPLLSPDEDPTIRVKAAYALAQRGVNKPEIMPALLAGLGTEWQERTFQGIRALGPLAKGALPALRARVTGRATLGGERELHAWRALGPAAAEGAPELIELIERRPPWITAHAAMALWQATGDDRAILYLRDLLRTPRPRGREFDPGPSAGAVEVLGEIGPRAKLAARWIPTEGESGMFSLAGTLAKWRITHDPKLALAIHEHAWDPPRSLDRLNRQTRFFVGAYYEWADALVEVMPQIAEQFARHPEPPDDDRRLMLARVARKLGRCEEALAHWRQLIQDRNLGYASFYVDLYQDLHEFGPEAKALAPEILDLIEHGHPDRFNILPRILIAIDREAYRAMLDRWANLGP